MSAADSLVSVIIPCYNQGRFLDEAIESVLHQTYRHFEVIVVDDGSTDNTPDVAAGHPEVLTIRQENQGVSTARNSGVRASKGDYLVFLDGDDRLLPHALALGVKHMRRSADSAMAFGRHRKIGVDGALLSTAQDPVVEKDHYRRLLLSNYIQTPSTVIFRRSVFEIVNGFNPLSSYAEDYELYLRIAREFPIVGYDEIVAEYRRHDANMSGDHALMSKVCLAVLKKQRPYVRGNTEWVKARQLGIKTYRKEWGETFFNDPPVRWRGGRKIKESAQDIALLMRYSLEVFPRRLGRKISRSFGGVWNKRALRTSGPK